MVIILQGMDSLGLCTILIYHTYTHLDTWRTLGWRQKSLCPSSHPVLLTDVFGKAVWLSLLTDLFKPSLNLELQGHLFLHCKQPKLNPVYRTAGIIQWDNDVHYFSSSSRLTLLQQTLLRPLHVCHHQANSLPFSLQNSDTQFSFFYTLIHLLTQYMS